MLIHFVQKYFNSSIKAHVTVTSGPFSIARVIARLNIGGPAIQAILMTDAFRKKGYRSILLTGDVPRHEGTLEYLAHEKGVVPVKIDGLSRKISWHKDLTAFWKLVRVFHHERPIVVHTHTAKAGTLGRLAAMVTRVPVRVHTFHGHVFSGYFSPCVTRIFLTVERFLARHTDRIIAISDSQKHDLANVYHVAPPDKIDVIPLGFDLEPFLQVRGGDGEFRRSLDFSVDSFLVGWIGRFTAIKDPDLFLSCVERLALDGDNLRFVMIGDGELRQACQQKIEASRFGTLFRLPGWQQHLERVYADLDLVVLTSVNEGTPVSVLEAMACARPFIATDIGGIRDLMVGPPAERDGLAVFKNGILVARDAGLLARAVTYVRNNPEMRLAMGEAGRNFVRTRFASQRLAEDLESLYLRLARQKSRQESPILAPRDRPAAAEIQSIPQVFTDVSLPSNQLDS